jgi:hypothetical protein
MAEDATRYLLAIVTSHFVVEMTLSLGRVSVTVFGTPLLKAPIM